MPTLKLEVLYRVYIIYSESLDQFYKGQTNNLENRLLRHNSKFVKATKLGAPWVLAWSTTKNDRASAIRLERKLKNLGRDRLLDFMRKFREGLSDPDDPDRIAGMS